MFLWLFYLSYGKIILFKRDPIKKSYKRNSLINKYNMNEHTLYSGLTSDPFTCIVGGPLGSGKTSFVIKLIKHADVMFTEIP